MAKPLEWNTLEQAARWFSEKTGEIWTKAEIIDFAIKRCRPDDIVEDIKYPAYFRAILPKPQRSSLENIAGSQGAPFTIVAFYHNDTHTFVSDDICVNGTIKTTILLFKENLIQLQISEKTQIRYIYSDEQSVYEQDELTGDILKPVIIYCELWHLLAANNPGLKFPLLPPIHVDIGMVGIRDEELKQLLREYLKEGSPKNNKKPGRLQTDKAACQVIAKELWNKRKERTKESIINSPELQDYKKRYYGKNTLSDWLKEVDPRALGTRRGRPRKNTLHSTK